MEISVKTVDTLLEEAQFRNSFKVLPKGDTYKDLSTVIVIPIPGDKHEMATMNCPHCQEKVEFQRSTISGLNPIFVEAFKRLIKPMNVPVIDMMIAGCEVADAYNRAVDAILMNPGLKSFKYMLTLEWDNIVPYIPNSQGPLMMLYEGIAKGYDVVGGLYWTKGIPSMPLIYGEPDADIKDTDGYFKVIHNFEQDALIECNGMGMGFTLFKMDIFRDSRLERPFFKTLQEHSPEGVKMYTQDLYFFEKIRKLNYKVAVDTRVKVGHLDFKSGIIY